MWQLPQYVMVCASEVLVYSVALQFSYEEAPSNMRAIMQAIFL